MRIIGGKYKGNTLYFPKDKGREVRPLKDIARESIFNLLIHSNKISFKFNNSYVLDLYSGTGSFGIECLSRQTKKVYFVEYLEPYYIDTDEYIPLHTREVIFANSDFLYKITYTNLEDNFVREISSFNYMLEFL